MRQVVIVAIAAVVLAAAVPVGAEHFDMMMSVQSSLGRAESGWDTSPPEGGFNKRQAVTAKAGEDLTMEWRCRSEFPHGTMERTTVRIYVAREAEIGQKAEPAANAPRVLENSFTADFLPKHSAKGSLHFRVLEPGNYLVRLQSENTLKEHDHEHFAAVDLKVE